MSRCAALAYVFLNRGVPGLRDGLEMEIIVAILDLSGLYT
jgi:hypothetical protein